MNTHTLGMFVTVSEEHSFSAAGRRLFVTASAVSQKMQALENEVGFPLFARKYNGVFLTEEGKAFYHGAVSVLQTLDRTLEDCRKMRQEAQKSIVISMHTQALIPCYQAFIRQNPDCKCSYKVFQEADVNAVFAQFLDGDIDVLEWPSLDRLSAHGVRFLERYRAAVCCVVAARHPFANRTEIDFSDLVGQTVKVYSHENQEVIEAALNRVLSEKQIAGVNFESFNGEANAIIAECEKGAVVLVSEAYAKGLPLVHLPFRSELCVYFGLAYRQNASQSVRRLIRFVAEYDQRHGVIY